MLDYCQLLVCILLTLRTGSVIYLFISSLFEVDLHLTYKKLINVNNNAAYISVNKLPNNNDNNKTKYLTRILRVLIIAIVCSTLASL